jgi:hypothetical protein
MRCAAQVDRRRPASSHSLWIASIKKAAGPSLFQPGTSHQWPELRLAISFALEKGLM